MNAKDFLKKYSTPDMEILSKTDSEQLLVLASPDDHEFVLQNERYLSRLLDLSMGFSMRFDGLRELNTPQKARVVFRGDEPELLCVTVKRSFADDMKCVKTLLNHLPTWRTLDVVLLDSADSDLGHGSKILLKDLAFTPDRAIKAERLVCSLCLGTEFFPWVFRITSTSNSGHKQPKLCILKLPEKGRPPKELVFEESEMPKDPYAIQSHVAWSADLYMLLDSTKDKVDEVPWSDNKATKYIFSELYEEVINTVVTTFGGKPRFALMPFEWYEGTPVEKKTTVVEMFTQKEHTSQYAPHMFGFVLSVLWQNGDVLHNDSAAIQQIFYNKLRIGLTSDTKKLLISTIDQMSPMGYILKDEETMDYVAAFDGDDSDVSTVMSEWGSIDVCYLIAAPSFLEGTSDKANSVSIPPEGFSAEENEVVSLPHEKYRPPR